ncbi:riboflavin synthase [bacterium]|nr:riboflavin synthase [bacterium]
MFTGIVEEIGVVKSLSSIGVSQLELCIGCRLIQDDLKIGDSVAIDGVCLTVVRFSKTEAIFELSAETLGQTLFSKKRTGDRVNLERALRLGDRLGGHIVQGHVDSCARLLAIQRAGDFFEIDFSLDPAIKRYVVHKGSISINGISLTIASLKEDQFQVAIIPHTFHQTSLSGLDVADEVHIETDMIGRYIERLLLYHNQESKEPSKITPAFLRDHGF